MVTDHCHSRFVALDHRPKRGVLGVNPVFAMGGISFRIVKYGGRWYAQARNISWILRLPTVPFWRVISRYDLRTGVSRLRKAHADMSSIYAHETSEEAAETISRFIDKLDQQQEKKRDRIEQIMSVEVVRRRHQNG